MGYPFTAMADKSRLMKPGILLLAILLAAGSGLAAADGDVRETCTYRENALGHYDYQCSDGRTGTLRQQAPDRYHDSQSGETYRRNRLGHYQTDDGKQVWRRNSLGHWQTGRPYLP